MGSGGGHTCGALRRRCAVAARDRVRAAPMPSRFVRMRIFNAESATCGSLSLASFSDAHVQFGFHFMAFSQTSRHLSEEEELVSSGPEISSLGSNANAFSRNFEARVVSPDAFTHKESALNASARNGFAPLLTFAALAAKVKIDLSSRKHKTSS